MIESFSQTSGRKAIVTAVIVTYHSRTTIDATLNALQEPHEAGLVNIVVVDNASSDGTADYVAQQYPSYTIVRSPANLGFGRGCNTGLQHTATPYALLLNPDAVLDIKDLKTLVDFMEKHPKVGICGPAVVEPSGALQPAGNLPNPWKTVLRPLLPGWASRGQCNVAPGAAPQQMDWICGSVMLLRMEMIKELGGFDPRFFLYFEETDLCCRAKHSGWQIWSVGEAVARHVNAASAKATRAPMIWGTISEHYFRSRFYYMRKHFGFPAAATAELGELACMVLRKIIDKIRGRTYTSLGLRLRAPMLRLPQIIDEMQVQKDSQ